jgi:hypothetical protein
MNESGVDRGPSMNRNEAVYEEEREYFRQERLVHMGETHKAGLWERLVALLSARGSHSNSIKEHSMAARP